MTAEVTIARVSSGHTEDYISIQVTNRTPLMRRWSLKVPLADFSRILTARGGIECDLEVRTVGPKGARPLHDDSKALRARIDRALAVLREPPREARTAREEGLISLLEDR